MRFSSKSTLAVSGKLTSALVTPSNSFKIVVTALTQWLQLNPSIFNSVVICLNQCSKLMIFLQHHFFLDYLTWVGNINRSEERRVGKECMFSWVWYDYVK